MQQEKILQEVRMADVLLLVLASALTGVVGGLLVLMHLGYLP